MILSQGSQSVLAPGTEIYPALTRSISQVFRPPRRRSLLRETLQQTDSAASVSAALRRLERWTSIRHRAVCPTFPRPQPYAISSNGRGTVTLNGLNFSFYPVSASRAKFIEIDTAALATPTTPASILVGDAYRQQTSSTCGWGLNALSGSTVFETFGIK